MKPPGVHDTTSSLPQIQQTADKLSLQTPRMELEWDLTRGGILVFLKDRRSGATLLDARQRAPAPDLVLAVSSALEEEPHDVRLSACKSTRARVFAVEDRATVRIEFESSSEELRILRTVEIRADSPWISETVALQNRTARDLIIDRYPKWEPRGGAVAGDLYDYRVKPGGVDYVLNGIRIGEDWKDDEYVTPACGYPFFHNHGRFAEMGDTEINLVAGHHGAILPGVMAWNAKRQAGLLLAVIHDRSLCYVHMAGDAPNRSGTLSARVWWARWLSPDEKQTAATFHLVPFAGDYVDLLVEFRDWLAKNHGLRAPADLSPVMEKLFIGALPGILPVALNHFEKLKPYVDAVAAVGCTAVWVGGHWRDAADLIPGALLSRCQPVTQDGRYAITPRFGGESAHRALRDYIRRKGLCHVVWITGYGLTAFDSIYKQHPEAFVVMRRPIEVRRENPDWHGFDFGLGRDNCWIYPPFGGPTVGSDTTNRIWRAFWLYNQEYWAAHGVDGVFFDSFNPMPPNYALRPWPGQISQEIIHLQREARRRARKVNPNYFTFTEGGGGRMATVNDFTHTWHGCDAPPLPPFRKAPLSPEEEAAFLRDEELTMIPGAWTWRSLADGSHQGRPWDMSRTRPRMLYSLFSKCVPILPLFTRNANGRPIKTQTEYWTGAFEVTPADQPHADDVKTWKSIGDLWKLRQAHPELRSGEMALRAAKADDRAVHALLRVKGPDVSVLAINFREQAVTCKLAVDLKAAGLDVRANLKPRDLLREADLPACTGEQLEQGLTVTIPPRDAVLIKFRGETAEAKPKP